MAKTRLHGKRKLIVAFGYGAAHVLGWVTFFVVAVFGGWGLLMAWRSLLRVVGGSADCRQNMPVCAMEATSADYVILCAAIAIVFALASAIIGYTRYYERQPQKRSTWPWPQD